MLCTSFGTVPHIVHLCALGLDPSLHELGLGGHRQDGGLLVVTFCRSCTVAWEGSPNGPLPLTSPHVLGPPLTPLNTQRPYCNLTQAFLHLGVLAQKRERFPIFKFLFPVSGLTSSWRISSEMSVLLGEAPSPRSVGKNPEDGQIQTTHTCAHTRTLSTERGRDFHSVVHDRVATRMQVSCLPGRFQFLR